jgi:hypothetical protein
MLDGFIVREQDRAAAQWRASCASDDALRERIDAQLSEGRLPSIHGGSGPVTVTDPMAVETTKRPSRSSRARRARGLSQDQ